MPIYEYQCKSCRAEFEELTFGDALPTCPHCSSSNTAKIMSRPCACRNERGEGSGDYAPSGYGGAGASGCSGCSGGSCATCGC